MLQQNTLILCIYFRHTHINMHIRRIEKMKKWNEIKQKGE